MKYIKKIFLKLNLVRQAISCLIGTEQGVICSCKGFWIIEWKLFFQQIVTVQSWLVYPFEEQVLLCCCIHVTMTTLSFGTF